MTLLNTLDSKKLLAVIAMQTNIAKLGPDLFHVMNDVCDHSQKLVNADAAVVELVEGEDMVYRSASGSATNMLGLRLKRNNSLSGLCTIERQTLYCSDSELDPRVDREACRKVGCRSMVVVPLLHGESAVGALKLMSARPNAFDEADIAVLSLSSELIAASMFYAGKYGMDELYKQATTDHLTGLSNRALFYDRLRLEMSKSNRSNVGFSVAIVDLDKFKPINDRFGHNIGDEVIKTQANRLRTVTREVDTVARIGGDEFAVLLPAIDKPDQLNLIAARIFESLTQPYRHELNTIITLSASVGTAIYPHEENQIEKLIHAADKKMYALKQASKDQDLSQ